MTCNRPNLPVRNDSCVLRSVCSPRCKAVALNKTVPFCTFVMVSFPATLSSAAMQPESGSLLQIESSLLARAAKQLSTVLRAITAALSHSECPLHFHYNSRCHSCFRFGALGYRKSLEVGSFLENYSKHLFYYAKLILGDVSFSAFKGSSFMVSGKQCSYESYNAGAV